VKQVGVEEIDNIAINVVKLNLETFQGDFRSTLFLHTDIDVLLARPISENREHVIPDLEVIISGFFFLTACSSPLGSPKYFSTSVNARWILSLVS
jgi:hypothetical protein